MKKPGKQGDQVRAQTRAATGDSLPKELYSQSQFVGMQGQFMDPSAFMQKPDAFPVKCIISRNWLLWEE